MRSGIRSTNNHLAFCMSYPHLAAPGPSFMPGVKEKNSEAGRQLRTCGETRPYFVRPDRDRGAGSVNENLACFGLTVDPYETHLQQGDACVSGWIRPSLEKSIALPKERTHIRRRPRPHLPGHTAIFLPPSQRR